MLFIQKSWEIIESKVDSSSSTWFHGNTQITDDDEEGRIMGRITGRTLRSSHCVFSVTSGSLTQCWEFFSCSWIDTLWNKWFLKTLVFLMCVSLSESLVLEGWWKEQRQREREIFLYISTLPVPLADTLPLYLCVSVCLCVPCVTVVAGADRETGYGLCWSVSVKSACQSLWLSNSCGTSLICRFKQCRCRMFVSLCNTVTSQVCCKNALTFVDMKQKGFFFFSFREEVITSLELHSLQLPLHTKIVSLG